MSVITLGVLGLSVLASGAFLLGGGVGCGGSQAPAAAEPKVLEPHPEREGSRPSLQVSQELGSIDEKEVSRTFADLVQGPVENCHKQGRDRLEVLSGDVKVFLRIAASGRAKYGWLEDSTIGDRETEKCILDVFKGAVWPKPVGGEAEVRSGFGWSPGAEREPTSWSPERATTALSDAKDVKKEIDKCRSGIKGDFRITAYVETDQDGDAKHKSKPLPKPGKAGPGRAGASKADNHAKPAAKEAGGRFKAIGIAAPNKEGAAVLDCMVQALEALELPSPGSYVAKVSFSL